MIAQFPYDKETPWFKNVRFIKNTEQLVSCDSCETQWKGYCPLCKEQPPDVIRLQRGAKKKHANVASSHPIGTHPNINYKGKGNFPKPELKLKPSPHYLPNDDKYGWEKQFKPQSVSEQTPEWIKAKLTLHETHRALVFERDGHKCLKCGSPDWLTVDHVIPKSWGGKNHPDNYQTLCYPCNSHKGNKNCDDYR